MNSSLSLSSITAPVTKFLEKYHATLFFTVIGLLLAGAILTLYVSIQTSETVVPSTEVISSNFDQETADKIKDLRDSNESSRDLVFPSPRSNPFVE